jgi:hypothetical protein
VKNLRDYRIQIQKEKAKQKKDTREAELEQKVEEAQAKMDDCKRFAIFVRGASPQVYWLRTRPKLLISLSICSK